MDFPPTFKEPKNIHALAATSAFKLKLCRMQETNRYLLTILDLYQSFIARIVSRYLLFSCMLKKWLK